MAGGVSVLIFTLNEEENLPSCLDSVVWCGDITVIDSFSRDRTETICKERGVRFVQHRFEGFGQQRNWALENVPIENDWVLILDADEQVPPALAEEITTIACRDPEGIGAYRLRRRLHMWGRWLRWSSMYPVWLVRLVRKDRIVYRNRGHAETQEVQGETGQLKNDLIDENRKGIDAWFERQIRYATEDAKYELLKVRNPVGVSRLLSRDPMERKAVFKQLAAQLPFRSLFYFVYCFVFRLGFLDGRDGCVFCRMKALYAEFVCIKKHDLRRQKIANRADGEP